MGFLLDMGASARPRLTMHKKLDGAMHPEKGAAMMATSPSSSAVSAAADVWTSRSGEPHPHGRGERTGHQQPT